MARVLRWGPGFTGCEDPLNLLRDVIDAEDIKLDRSVSRANYSTDAIHFLGIINSLQYDYVFEHLHTISIYIWHNKYTILSDLMN